MDKPKSGLCGGQNNVSAIYFLFSTSQASHDNTHAVMKLGLLWHSYNTTRMDNVRQLHTQKKNVTTDSVSYTVGCNVSPIFSPHLFTFWKIKSAELAITSSFLLLTIGCADNYQWTTVILKKSEKPDDPRASSEVFHFLSY